MDIHSFYIYRYLRLDTNTPFYVGKGRGNRYKQNSQRNKYFKNIISSVPYEVEIMIENLSEGQAFSKEIEFIKLYKNLGYCEANLTNGGEGCKGRPISEENKMKISQRFKGNKFWVGKKHTEETKAKISKTSKNRKWSIEARKKQSRIQKGKKFSQIHKNKIAKANFKQVIDLSTGFVWDSAKEAAQIYGINYNTLKSMLNGAKNNKTNLRYI
jgi:hypothetical protein